LWMLFLVEAIYLIPVLGGFGHSEFFASILPSVLIDSANNDRQTDQLNRLRYNPLLEEAAKLKANDMAELGYFAHTSPAGIDPWHWLKEVGYNYTSAGENLAVNFSESQDIHTAWMNSPSHRANILDSRYTEIGIATATGIYKGQETIFVVEFFGKPAKKISVAQLPSAPSPKLSTATKQTEEKNVAGISTTQPEFVEVFLPTETIAQPEVSQAGFFQRFMSNPRGAFNDVFAGFFALVALAMILTMYTRSGFEHHPAMVNGLSLVVGIVALMLFNEHISNISASIF